MLNVCFKYSDTAELLFLIVSQCFHVIKIKLVTECCSERCLIYLTKKDQNQYTGDVNTSLTLFIRHILLEQCVTELSAIFVSGSDQGLHISEVRDK